MLKPPAGTVAVAPPNDLIVVNIIFDYSNLVNLRAAHDRNNLGRHHIRGDVDLIVIPHLASLLPKIKVVGAPGGWAITIIGKWKSASNDKHLTTVDHIASHGMVWIANSRSFPPFDPCERWKAQNIDIIEAARVCAEP